MDRFVAMMWEPADTSRLWLINAWCETLKRASPSWTCVLEIPGVRVFSLAQRGDAPIVTHWENGQGIAIGVLFERTAHAGGRVRKLDRAECGRVAETNGQALVGDYWGNYVAIWRDHHAQSTQVLRDPCGAVPCFFTNQQGLQLIFSHADDVSMFSGVRFAVDWTFIQAFILFNYFVTTHTGLDGVSELLAGERLKLHPDGSCERSWSWNGFEMASQPLLMPFADAKAELHAAAELCFRAWGSEYKNIIASVSGGLDSSILINLLRRTSDAEVLGLHFLGDDYEAYESDLARLAAEHANVELLEVTQDPLQDDIQRMMQAARLARPKVQILAVQIDDICVKIADARQVDAFMIGQGGDNIFLQRSGANHLVSDCLRAPGGLAQLPTVAYDAASLRQYSVWKALSEGLEGALAAKPWDPHAILQTREFMRHCPLTPECIESIPASYKTHPWLQEAHRLPRGKADHLASVIALYNYYIDHWRGLRRDVVYPLFSQPILELALRTPTHILCRGGQDRALERAAFTDILPAAIARRTMKGGTSYYSARVIQHNMSFLRELILDGEIARQGWMNREKIEAMLTPEHMVHGGGKMFVRLLAVAEAWLCTWGQSAMKAAA